MPSKPSPFEISFGTFLVYPTRGTTPRCKTARDAVLNVKRDYAVPGKSMRWPEYTVRRLMREPETSPLRAFLAGELFLVPLPRSSLLPPKGWGTPSLWPAHRICEALIESGIGREIVPCLQRTEAVRKSATAPRGERPTPEAHYATIGVHLAHFPPQATVLLVDDVITRGATMLGAAWRLQKSFPTVTIKGFATALTRGSAEDIDNVVEPHVGRIWYDGAWLRRDP